MVFDDYYDEVTYVSVSSEKDYAGFGKKSSPVILKCRLVDDSEHYMIATDSTVIKYNYEFQLPQIVNTGDFLNGRLVLDTQTVNNVFGEFEFCIARTE